MGKTIGIILGIILMLAGLGLAGFGVSKIANTDLSFSSFTGMGLGIGLIFGGIVLIIIGAFIIYLSNLKKIFSYVAKETAPMTEEIGRAVGKGIAKGVKEELKK
jgi:hypothetical protein